MELIDFGWVIGILEGEGCFGTYVDKRNGTTTTVKIQVESTDYDVIVRLNNLVPGKIWESNYPSKFKAFPKAKLSWRWSISSKRKVKELCQLVYPHMSDRRKQQIDKVLINCIYINTENK